MFFQLTILNLWSTGLVLELASIQNSAKINSGYQAWQNNLQETKDTFYCVNRHALSVHDIKIGGYLPCFRISLNLNLNNNNYAKSAYPA